MRLLPAAKWKVGEVLVAIQVVDIEGGCSSVAEAVALPCRPWNIFKAGGVSVPRRRKTTLTSLLASQVVNKRGGSRAAASRAHTVLQTREIRGFYQNIT